MDSSEDIQRVPSYNFTTQSNSSLTCYVTGSCICISLAIEPNMGQLCKIVIPKVMAQWKDIAYISFNYDVPKVRAIEENHKGDSKKCCQQLFEDWMCTNRTGDSKTWKSLLTQLKQIEDLTVVVERISEELTEVHLT